MEGQKITNSTDIICIICGQSISSNVWVKRKERGRDDWKECQDCTAKPTAKIIVHHPSLGQIQCYPHQGEVNELWQPLDASGNLYRPGVRLCGNKDCVNTAHIEKPAVKTISDIDLILMSMEVRAKYRARVK